MPCLRILHVFILSYTELYTDWSWQNRIHHCVYPEVPCIAPDTQINTEWIDFTVLTLCSINENKTPHIKISKMRQIAWYHGCHWWKTLRLMPLKSGLALITPNILCSPLQVCLVAYLGLFMLCVSYQVDERTCIQFSMKVSFFYHLIERSISTKIKACFVRGCISDESRNCIFRHAKKCFRRALIQTQR